PRTSRGERGPGTPQQKRPAGRDEYEGNATGQTGRRLAVERLTSEQEALMPVIRDEWLAHGLSTEPADRDEAERGVRDAYREAELEPPRIVVWLGSPFAGALGAAMLDQVGDQVG